MLQQHQVEHYREAGYLVIEDVIEDGTLDELRRVTDALLEQARSQSASDDVFDLADDHAPDRPRVNRIKGPHRQHPAYAALMRSSTVLDVVADLIGPNIRFDHSKLNCKPAGGGATIEWHQDWAFYPQTNDDMLSVNVMLDDCEADNGPLHVIPGSHMGPILDHHHGGWFIGAIDPTTPGLAVSSAVALMGPAGSLTVHHVRTVHGSPESRSERPRRLLNLNYAAADTWPLLTPERSVPLTEDPDAFETLTVRGEATIAPRLASVPVRLPVPGAKLGSIFEQQQSFIGRSFGTEA
jgi:ectoine hydroxylase-related dioxygenase (phytanoyl-CoA dioxygenase family)